VNPVGKDPNKILKTPIKYGSSWHFFQAESWLDYAIREQAPSSIYYAAIEIRYGIEFLFFEVLVLNCGYLTEGEYKKCIKNYSNLKKMVKKHEPNYTKLAEFSEDLASLSPNSPNIHIWDIHKLLKYHGISSRYLHFMGKHEFTFQDTNWLIRAIAKLDDIFKNILKYTKLNKVFGLMPPSDMEPEVHKAWTEYESGLLSREELKIRMNIALPILRIRRNQ